MDDLSPLTTQPFTPSEEPCPLRAFMSSDAQRLLDTFERLIVALEVDDRTEARLYWRSFETRLLRRMRLEEQLLLPTFAAARPVEAQLLRQDQQLLAAALLRIGTHFDLNLLRAESVGGFFGLLRAHAYRKDAMYAWAHFHVSAALRTQLLEVLQRAAEGRPSADSFSAPPGVTQSGQASCAARASLPGGPLPFRFVLGYQ